MAVAKIDPKVIFASEAPTQDTPAVFTNKTVGWGESRKNGGRPTIKQSNALQQETDLKILWLNENSVTPFDATIDYPENAVTIKDGIFKILKSGIWELFLDKSSVGLGNVDNTSDLNKPVSTATQTALNLKADKSATYTKAEVDNAIDLLKPPYLASDVTDGNQTQDQINLYGAKTYDMPAGGYPVGGLVRLDNGDIVKSTVDGNTNDPNVNMAGWFLIGSDKITTVESVNDLSGIAKWDGRVVETKSYYAPNFALANPYRGGSKYIYNTLRASENDGFSCINGWVQLADVLTFDSCGVYVDDSTKRVFNTTRITAILTYAINNKKPVEAEVGRYYANTVSLDRVNFDSTAFNLAGQGKKKTIFDFAIELVSSSTTTGSAFSLRWQHVKFKGFYLNPTTSVSAALTLQRVGMIYGDDVDISYSGTGFKLRGGSEVFFKNCDIYSCFRGLDLHSATDGVNGGIEIDFAVISFDNCNISNCTKHEIYKARSLYFTGGNFNANLSDSAYFYNSQLISFTNVSIESSRNFVFTNCSNIQLDKALMGLVASDKFVLINSTVTDNVSVWEGGTGQIKLDAASQYISKSTAIYYPTFNIDHTNANLSNITFDFLPQNSMLLSNSIFTRKSHYPIIMNSANYTFSNSNPNYLKTGTYYIECTGGVVMLIPINSDFAGFEIIGKQIPVPELHTGSASLGALGSRGVFVSVQTLGELRRYIYVPSPSFKNLITVGGQLYIAFSLFNGSVIDSVKVFTTSKAYSNLINRVTNTSTVTIPASSKTVVTYNVSGAVLGDRVTVSVNQDTTNVSLRAWVSAADTVAVEFSNLTASSITLTGARVSVDVS